MTALRQRMLEDLRIRNYSPSTVRCYIRFVAEFAKHFKKPPDQLGSEEIRAWQLFLLNEKRVKLSTYIQAVCALRFFYQNTLHRRIEIDRIPLPRYEKKLPVILSKAEVKALLEAPKNLKHRAMLATMYGAGLRVSEVANLKVCDLDRERHVIWVRGVKGTDVIVLRLVDARLPSRSDPRASGSLVSGHLTDLRLPGRSP
jgi:integrase/recombinase XerD